MTSVISALRIYLAPFLRACVGLSAVSLLSACSTQPQDATPQDTQDSGQLAPATGPDRPTALREQAMLDWLRTTLPNPSHAAVYQAAVEQARGRALYCDTETCSSRFLASRQSRLDFADGKPNTIRFLPFDNGVFTPTVSGYAGIVRIIPLIDRKAMLVISLRQDGQAACALDGVMNLEDDDTWTVTSLDQSMPIMVITPVDGQHFDLTFAENSERSLNSAYCTNGKKIDGRYAIHKSAPAN